MRTENLILWIYQNQLWLTYGYDVYYSPIIRIPF